MHLIIFFLFSFLFWPGAAQALCVGPELDSVPASVTFQGASGQYEVFDTATYTQSVSFKVKSVANALGCNYYVTLSAGSSGNLNQRELVRGAGEKLRYNAYKSASLTSGNILKDNTAGSSNHIVGSFPAVIGLVQSNDHTLYWTIEPGQVFVTSGTQFADNNLSLRLYAELILGIYTLVDTKTISFKAKAESSVDLSLVNAGGSFNKNDTSQSIAFGDLVSGQMQAYDTIIRSNAANYAVTMQSQNGQKLAHQNDASKTIPYSVSFGGGSINLSSGNSVQVTSSSAVTDSNGARFNTQFTVGTMTGAEPAGTYQDIISVTVSAN